MPEFTVTSYGVRARLPVVQVCDDDTSIAIAVLACQGPEGSIIGLLLHQQENMGGIPLYRIGVHAIHHDIGRPYPLYRAARYVRIHLSPHYDLPSTSAPTSTSPQPSREFSLAWRELYLVYHAHSFGFANLRGLPAPVASRPLLSPCRLFFPPYVLARLERVGFEPDRALSIHQHGTVERQNVNDPFEVMFTHARTLEAFSVRVASCLRPTMSLPHAHANGKGNGNGKGQEHRPFRHMWAAVEASWPALPVDTETTAEEVGPNLAVAERARGSSDTDVRVDAARRCYWCRETHLDQWAELDAQAGRTGRQRTFPFVGKSVTLTFSQWDARSRPAEGEAGGGGLYAVDIVVGDDPGPWGAGGASSGLEAGRVEDLESGRKFKANGDAKPAAGRAQRRSSSLVRSMLAAVHQQVRGT